MTDNSVHELTIDFEFQSLIPPLSNDEFKCLEKSLVKHGYQDWREPIITWNGTIIDGMNLFLKYNRLDFDRDRFVKAFSTIDYKTIVNDAKAFYKSMSDRAYTMPVCAYLMIGRKYNNGLRTNRIKLVTPE